MYPGAPIRAKGQVLGAIMYFKTRSKSSAWKNRFARNIASQIGDSRKQRPAAPDLGKGGDPGGAPAVGAQPARFGDPILYSLNLLAEGYRKQAPRAKPEEVDGWL